MKVERWQLQQRQAEPLDIKILMSKERIKQWYQHWDGRVYVAFSGGLDSTALLHLVRSMYPDVPAVFSNTGVEFPEIVKFVKQTENVHFIRPKKTFKQVVQEKGYPVISKIVSKYVRQIRSCPPDSPCGHLRRTGYTQAGKYMPIYKLSNKWSFLVDAPFKMSEGCCDVLKKTPARMANKKYGHPMLGMRADDSKWREGLYLENGCNGFSMNEPHSWPMAFWTHQDVWDYIHKFNVPYSTIYDMGYDRTGCFPCMFGVHMESYPNRFQRMYDTHPKLWRYCMDKLGIQEVLDYIGIESRP